MTRWIRIGCLIALATGLASGVTAGRAAGAAKDRDTAIEGTLAQGRRGGPPPAAEAPTAVQILEGTDENDTLTGGDGDDWLLGKGGLDILRGGGGRDKIDGSEGEDNIDGGPGDDIIDGGAGSDTLRGGDGNDTIDGGDDDDLIDGNAGNDDIDGGDGNDTVRGGSGDDVLAGGDENDSLFGDGGNDRLSGGDGSDALSGGAGNDVLMGGEGNDSLAGDAGDDRLDGADGNDVLHGGAGDDVLLGSAGDDTLHGEAGHDTLLGGDGADTLDGGLGLDWLHGGTGVDVVNGGDGDDIFVIRAGDVPTGGIEIVNGGPGTDALFLDGFDLGVQLSGETRLVDPVTGGIYVILEVERVEYTAVLARVEPSGDRPLSLLLVNPSATPSSGRVVFAGPDGAIATTAAAGAEPASDDLTFTVPPRGSVRLSPVVSGAVAAQVFATSPLGVMIDGASEGSGDPASLASPLLDSAIVPVIEDQAAGIGTGVIILNSATESSVKLTVHDAEGRERDNLFRGSRQFELPAYGHRVVFFRELYPDLGDFRGTVTVDGGTDRPQEGGPIAVVALERGPGGALAGTAAPSLSPVSPTGPSYLAGVTAGGDRRAAVLVVNPSINRHAVGTVRFFDGTGRPWPVVAGAQGPTDTASFDLSQTAVATFELRAGGSLEHARGRR